MGICASTQMSRMVGGKRGLNWPSTAKVIHPDGRLQEFVKPTRAGQIISQNPNCFLCSSESMYQDSYLPAVPENEELQLGQIYFLLPISRSRRIFSLPDLCALAVKAGAALGGATDTSNRQSLPRKNSIRISRSRSQGCRVPTDFGVTRQSSRAVRSNQTIGY